MKRKKILATILAVLLLLAPLYSLAREMIDESPNNLLLGQSGQELGESGRDPDREQDFYDHYILEAPDRKIPLDMDFDLLYGLSVTDKNGEAVEHKIDIIDTDGFDVSLEGSYKIAYLATVEGKSASFERLITVTPYRVDMNNLVIVKEQEPEDGNSVPEYELSEKELEIQSFEASLFGAAPLPEEAALLLPWGEVDTVEEGAVEGVYLVAPADISTLEPDNQLELEKLKKEAHISLGASASAKGQPEELDILSTDPEGVNLVPLDLRYGIDVLNPSDESIVKYLEVADDDEFSMETADKQQFDVDYAIVYQGEVAVQLHRSVNLLGNTRAIIPSTEMIVSQTIKDRNGRKHTLAATWLTDGNLYVTINDKQQYHNGKSSGTVLRFLDGPLQVTEARSQGGTRTHDIVGDNIHSFVGFYVQEMLYEKGAAPALGLVDFNTLSGTTVKRKAFAGADDQSVRSPLLINSEVDLRNKVSSALNTEFKVFQEEQIDGLTMKRSYKYYPLSILLNKDSDGVLLNDKPLFELEVIVRLVPGELKLQREITITNLAYDYVDGTGSTPVFKGHLLYLADTFFDGVDYGFGFRDELEDKVFVRGVNDGARTMRLGGHQDSEAYFAGAWYWAAAVVPPGYKDRYTEVYGPNWAEEALFVHGGTPLTGLFDFLYPDGRASSATHAKNPYYSLHFRTPLEGELPINLNTLAYPIGKGAYDTNLNIPGNHVNGSYDTAYAMQWPLPPTPVGESYTFVIEEDWLEASHIQIVAPGKEVVSAGQSKTLRFSAENTHMFDYAQPVSGQEWDINATFTVVAKGLGTAFNWAGEIVKVYKVVNDVLVDVTPTAGSPFTFQFVPGDKYYFDVEVTVDRYATVDQENEISLKADGTNRAGFVIASVDETLVIADTLATITAVTAQNISTGSVTAKVDFNNPALIDPQDPTFSYNTTVKLYDSGGIFIKEVSDKIASGGTLTLTGLTLVEGNTYKLVATAEPEATGIVETTFDLSTEEATITYAKAPGYAIISGMPAPLSYTAKYLAGSANFTMAPAPSAVGLLFAGWEDTEKTLTYAAGAPFSMLLSDARRAATLTTKWTVDPNYKITIDFNANGGTGTVASQTKFVGDRVDVPGNTVSKVGYKLTAWTTTKDVISTKWDFATILTGNPQQITLYAYWEIDPNYKITIDFNVNGGTGSVASQSRIVGESVAAPTETISKLGYKLTAWTTTKDVFSTKWDFATILMGTPQQITLYAYWEVDPNYKITIDFNANGGTGSVASQSKNVEDVVDVPANTISKLGYNLTAWTTTKDDDTTKWDFTKKLTALPTQITLYAYWEVDPNYKITIDFNANGGTGSVASQSKNVEDVVDVPANTISKLGYKLTAWTTTKDNISTKWDFTKKLTALPTQITLYAYWEIDPNYKITIDFNANGGTGTVASQSKNVEDVVDVPANTISKLGYNLTAWTTTKDNISTKWDFTKKLTALPTQITLYAYWEVDPNYKITIDFDVNGGTGTVASQSKNVEDVIDKPTVTISKTGYKLTAWTTTKDDGTTKWDFTKKLTALPTQITLYAYWEIDPNYKITIDFNANGGTGTVASQSKIVGDKVDPPANTISKLGYNLTDWTTIKDDKTTKWDFATILTGTPQQITLYAYWEVDPNYKITIDFDVNGGTGTVASQTKLVEAVVDIPTETISKIGYKLTDWTTTKDDVSTKWDFSKKLTALPAQITLYAFWEDDPDSWKLTFVEVPNLEFKTTKIGDTSNTIPLVGNGLLKIRDTYPGKINGWAVTVSSSQLKSVNSNILNKGALQYFDAAGLGQSIFYDSSTSEGGPVTIWTETNSATVIDYQRTFDTNLKETFGVKLMPVEGFAEKYTATVTWSINIT